MKEKTLLLVDDEADIREVVGLTLSDMGYRVLTAENGEAAIRIFKEHRPPIVLTDIKMPGMDGIALLQKIKQIDPEAEVIMITGHGDMNLAIRSFQDDAADFITKPIGVDALETALKRVQEKILIRGQLRSYTENLEALLLEKSRRREVSGAPSDGAPAAALEQLQHALDRLPCYISLQDPHLTITAANRRFLEDFGNAVGKFCYTVCMDRKEPCPDCPVLKTFQDGKSYQYEMEYLTRSGAPRKVLAWTLPVPSAGGGIPQVMVMSTDVARISELQDHLSSLGLMAGSLSHGIKGLLTGLDSGMYLLDTGIEKQNRDRTREGLEVVKQTVDRLKKTVLDVLFYAKDRELKKEIVEAAEFAEDVARMVEPKISSRGIEFVREFSRPLGSFSIDAGLLIQALVNIFDNALEACLEDRSKPSHAIVFRVAADEHRVTMEIRDDGIGMDAKTQENLFTLFFSSKGKQGTGLGLFITRKIVQQHGGDITVQSILGQGTRIQVRTPR